MWQSFFAEEVYSLLNLNYDNSRDQGLLVGASKNGSRNNNNNNKNNKSNKNQRNTTNEKRDSSGNIDLSLWNVIDIIELSFGGIITVIATFVNGYIFLWALEAWDILDFQWLREIFGLGEEWKESLLLIDFFGIPIGYVRNFVLAFEDAEQYNPSNEGFITWFQLVIYPILWILSTEYCLISIFTMPGLMLLYLIDEDLFVDQTATELDPVDAKRPRIGLPSSIAEIYNLYSLLWGEYTYLEDKTDLSISFLHMLKLWAFGWFQLSISAIADPVMLIWSFFSLGALINVIVYDILVLGISFDDAMNYDGAEIIEAEYEGASDYKEIKIDFGDDEAAEISKV